MLCTLTADISQVPMTTHTNAAGNLYYRVDFEIVILFGLTEIQAQLAWKDKVNHILSHLVGKLLIHGHGISGNREAVRVPRLLLKSDFDTDNHLSQQECGQARVRPSHVELYSSLIAIHEHEWTLIHCISFYSTAF